MGVPIVRISESIDEEIEVISCFYGACYAESIRLGAKVVSVVDRLQSSLYDIGKEMHSMPANVKATCARSQEVVTTKDEELFEANMRLSAKNQELFDANRMITSMAKEIKALR
ncbi:hypothetical protein V6N13_073294 [Hibiscus sabdariffa]|uniref:Uncharacterized protein n=1 Tax=Hibiscus sabdariffa TaxID=183260 RepID=A0ABR2E8R2_9ROSI